MRPVEGPITTDFFEKRPLSKPPEERDHMHGAIDISAPQGTAIKCPERGRVRAWCGFRPKDGEYWVQMPKLDGAAFPWANYFYDMYGAILVVAAESRTHIIAHSFAKQAFMAFDKIRYLEEEEVERFPLHALYTKERDVQEGEVIGYVGNAGYSTGPHIHWEIHGSQRWQRWEHRINPANWR